MVKIFKKNSAFIHSIQLNIVFKKLLFNRINCYDAITPQTPFGGFKQSGIGREL